ncbi:ATP-binding cassette domain-containing protein [Salmonella enterica subsp. enterica]|nr:ATP-binding cassette domain-containing protein [Salmonella enterica subsp. enterica]
MSPGEISAIVGTSGAGKSYLLRTLNALTRPSRASTSTAWKFRRWTEVAASARQRIAGDFPAF